MKKHILYLLISALFFVSCASTQNAIKSGRPYTEQINWPEAYEPSKATFFVHNRIEIQAPPQVVWDILIQAETWPEWYEGASNVNVRNSENGILEEGSVFTWKTMGLNFESTVKEFIPPSRLSWESRKAVIQGYHAWLIIPTASGCILVTDESQRGWLAVLEKIFLPTKLGKLHDVWLAEIKKRAESAVNATSAKP